MFMLYIDDAKMMLSKDNCVDLLHGSHIKECISDIHIASSICIVDGNEFISKYTNSLYAQVSQYSHANV